MYTTRLEHTSSAGRSGATGGRAPQMLVLVFVRMGTVLDIVAHHQGRIQKYSSMLQYSFRIVRNIMGSPGAAPHSSVLRKP